LKLIIIREMNTPITVIIALCFAFCMQNAIAQVAIPYDASIDPAAELAITSSDKGLLIPELITKEIYGIKNPAEGLFVFDKDNNMIRFFNGTEWTIIGAMPEYSTVGRPANSSTEGAMIFDTDLHQILFYDGTGWKTLDKVP